MGDSSLTIETLFKSAGVNQVSQRLSEAFEIGDWNVGQIIRVAPDQKEILKYSSFKNLKDGEICDLIHVIKYHKGSLVQQPSILNPAESLETSPIFKAKSLTKSEHIELINAVKDSKFDERGPFLNVNFSSVNQIYIRDAYKKLQVHSLSLLIKDDNKDVKSTFSSIILMGTPGVGKTYFSLYLIKILCDKKIPFIYDAKTAENELTNPLFFLHGKVGVVKEENIEMILESVTGLFYIVDGKSPILPLSSHSKVATILVCSPRTEYYKQFIKRIAGDYKRLVHIYYLPTWDKDELKTANQTDYNDATIDQRFSICGGVARSVYSLQTECQLKMHIIQAIIDSDFERLRNFVNSGGTSDFVSHTLISLGVDDTLTTIRPFLASEYIIEQLSDKFYIDIQNELTRFFDCDIPHLLNVNVD